MATLIVVTYLIQYQKKEQWLQMYTQLKLFWHIIVIFFTLEYMLSERNNITMYGPTENNMIWYENSYKQ